ncbi:MAG: methyl-accepting chemotaxis protein [Pseudobdellovibrionaceae bacterium]|jgi:methyl-accepting chemotaxis protein|nr:methyl-accepting chemotaxis protein [Pseudobdellovibrionaceae bacterium]
MRLSNIKSSIKTPIIMVLLAAFNVAVVSMIAIYESENLATRMTEEKTASIADGISDNLVAYVSSIKEDLIITSDSDYVRQAIRSFRIGWEDIKAEDKTSYLQKAYITDNPNPSGEKHLLDAASDSSLYSTVHPKFHPWFRKLLTERDYYDIFLFDERGNLLYTVFKEADFGTNMYSGKWKDTDLALLYKTIKDNPVKDNVVYMDFRPYAPSNDVPAAFIGAPILDSNGNFMGVLAYQMPIERINNIGIVHKEASKTAIVRMVSDDFLYRNDPDPTDDDHPILVNKFENEAVKSALAGKLNVFWDTHDGKDVLIAAAHADVFGKSWAISVSIDREEALVEVNQMKIDIFLSAIVVLIIAVIISLLFSRTITSPLNTLSAVMIKLANRDFSVDVPYLDRKDEMGDMARTVGIFKENGLAVEKLTRDQEEAKLLSEQEKKEAMHTLANDFDRRTAGIIKSLAAAATEMQATSNQMTSLSANTAHASQIVASAAHEADGNVQVVAAAAEELSASSREIAQQITNVAHKSGRASGEAERTSKQVNELNDLADSIGDVISSIKEIAEQTNLLALNATIEAARAGEAGKGFAVVADEVKKLATETAQKTIEIDERVGRIQEAIRSSVEAVERIISDVREIDHATSTVAGAVEEQNAATAEIGRNVSEASNGTQQVAQNIHDVQRNAEETGESAVALNQAASELAKIAETLQKEVGDFLSEIRVG